MHFRQNDMNDAPSRIFLGKNKLLQIALGRSPEDGKKNYECCAIWRRGLFLFGIDSNHPPFKINPY